MVAKLRLRPAGRGLDLPGMKPVETPETPVQGGRIWPLTEAAYHTLGEAGLIPKNTELLYGVVYKKMSKSPLHSALVRRILRLLQSIELPERFVTSEQPITCEDSEPEPDVAVVRGTEEDFWREHPSTAELVIEVCITSHDYDRSKLRAYARAGVKECWLVFGAEKMVEVMHKPSRGKYSERRSYGPGERIICTAVPEFVLNFDALFAR
jgi:Uma2 family endonuclease